jgi:branched-subunit amino acid ABC-type transport system permease component
MNKMTTKRSIAIAIAGAMTIGVAIPIASPAFAAPVLSNTAAVATAAPSAVTDVRYYRNGYHRGYRNHGGAIVGGLALGVIGAVAAQRYYRDRTYDEPYGYRDNSYGYGYAPGYDYDRHRGW